jgi:hypothetical protein
MAEDDRRHALDRRVTPSIIAAPLLRRLSWRAVAAGTVLTLALQATFTVLGQALGNDGAEGIFGPWLVITVVGSLIPGAWAAARSAGIPSHPDSALHGLFTWAATVLVLQSWGPRFLGTPGLWEPGNASKSLWAFLALLAGAAAAGAAGWTAAPQDVVSYPRKSTATL